MTFRRSLEKEKRSYKVLMQLEVAFKLIDIRKYDEILICKLFPENQLITSDNPVILSNFKPGIIAPFDPENMIKLPIDTNHILTIMPHSQSTGEHRISRVTHTDAMSSGKMIVNNYSQYSSSFKYILGTKKGISDFISKKTDYEKPATEEQKKKLEEITTIVNMMTNKVICLTHAQFNWLTDVHFAGFAPAFTLSLGDSERTRKPPMLLALGRYGQV